MRQFRLGWMAAAVTWVFAAGCDGNLNDHNGPGTSSTSPNDFACRPGDPSATVLQRLSHRQHLAVLRDFVARSLGSADDADGVMAALEPVILLLPPDGSLDHDRLDQAVTQVHVDGQYQLASGAAAELLATAQRRDNVLGTCASDSDPSNDQDCLESFIRRIGYFAHRRPLSDAEVAFYRDEVYPPAAGMDVRAFQDVIATMLLSPNFLYRMEMEGTAVPGRDGLFELSGHELAARLALHFWDGAPDAELYAAADSGDLLSEEGYAAQVDRLLADPRTVAAFDRLYAEWLLLDDLAPLDTQLGTPIYDAFVGSDQPTSDLRGHMIEDALRLTQYLSWQSEGEFASLFTTNLNVTKTPDMAAIYGNVPVWQDGTDPSPLPGNHYAGILTRPAMTASGSVLTHPTLRGRDVRRRILCDDLSAPPADVLDGAPMLDPIMTERETMTALTEDPNSSCISCHEWINPIGYSFEAYDGLGRFRTAEVLYNDDGSVLATLPLDTVVEANLELGDDRVVKDGLEMSAHIAESNKARACFARHYFRFTFGRVERDETDGCELETIRAALEEGQSLRHVFRNIAMSPTFRLRKLAD